MNHRLDVALAKAKAIIARYPSLADDDTALRDTFEGATTIFKAFSAILSSIEDDEAMVDALKAQIAARDERRKRLEARVESKREALRDAMDATHQSKVTLPEATLTVRPGNHRIVVTDAAAIPREHLSVTVRPNLSSIGQALASGETIPGVTRSNGAPSLSIRRK